MKLTTISTMRLKYKSLKKKKAGFFLQLIKELKTEKQKLLFDIKFILEKECQVSNINIKWGEYFEIYMNLTHLLEIWLQIE